MSILWIVIIGFVAGIIARFLAPGPNNPSGFILTTLLGIAGAFIATWIGQSIGRYRPDQGAGLIGAVVGALVVLFIWHRLVTSGVVPTPATGAGCSFRSALAASGIAGAAVVRVMIRRGARRSTTTARGAPVRPAMVQAADVLALTHAQHGAARLFDGDLHQRRDDLDLPAELVGQALRRQHRLFDCRRVAPHPAPAIFRVPYVAHVAPIFLLFAALSSDYQRFAALQQVYCAMHSQLF